MKKDIGLGKPERRSIKIILSACQTQVQRGGKKADLISQSLISPFVVRYEFEVVSIGKRDSKRVIEVATMLKFFFRKLRRGLKQKMKMRGESWSPWETPRHMEKDLDGYKAEVTMAESWEHRQLTCHWI